MTVTNSTNPKNTYSGNGVNREFPFSFPVSDIEHVRVYVTDQAGTPTEATTSLSKNIISSKVVYPTVESGLPPLTSLQKITLIRETPKTQEASLSNSGSVNLKVLEAAYDKNVLMIQEMQEGLSRCIRYSLDQTPSSTETQNFLSSIEGARDLSIAAKNDSQAAAVAASASQVAAESANTAAGLAQIAAEAAKTIAETKSSEASASSLSAATSESNALASKEAAATSEINAGLKAGEALSSANDSAASALISSTKANEALASANAAAQAVQSIAWRDVVFITITDSPFAITSAHNGKMLSVDTSGGAVIVNLPSIATIDLATPFAVGIKKTDDSANGITINTNGTDKLDGASSKLIETQNAGATLIPDVDPNPDAWTSCDFGPASGGGAYAVFTLENVTNGAAITTTTKNQRQFRIVQGNGGEATTASAPFGASGGWKDGTEILLCGASDTSPLTIDFSDIAKGVILNGPAQLKQYYQLSLIYIQSLDRWLEISRNF